MKRKLPLLGVDPPFTAFDVWKRSEKVVFPSQEDLDAVDKDELVNTLIQALCVANSSSASENWMTKLINNPKPLELPEKCLSSLLVSLRMKERLAER